MNKDKIRQLTMTAVMTAVIVFCSWITIPYIVPFTLQTFAVFCALQILGGKNGTISIALYIFLGIIGVPVFSGFQGGAAHIMGPTGGYIIGFIFSGLCYLLFEPLITKKPKLKIPVLILSLLICYLIGSIWFYIVYANNGSQYSFINVLSLCVIPYLLPDAAKLILSLFICPRISKALQKI